MIKGNSKQFVGGWTLSFHYNCSGELFGACYLDFVSMGNKYWSAYGLKDLRFTNFLRFTHFATKNNDIADLTVTAYFSYSVTASGSVWMVLILRITQNPLLKSGHI